MATSSEQHISTRFFQQQTAHRQRLGSLWSRFWMKFAWSGYFGRFATRLAAWTAPPYRQRRRLARYHRKGYISHNASIYHNNVQLGTNVFIGDRVMIYQDDGTGSVEIGNSVRIHQDVCIETGAGGSVAIGAETGIQPRCQLSAYKAPIHIGRGVMIAPNCAFYPYDHGIAPHEPIKNQPLQTKGGITIDDDAWLGYGVIVLDGVRIGKGAVVGAGAVVTKDIPDGAIAVGSPARVISMRSNLVKNNIE
ncbi:DapH/DapD/GlmU-related protein [Chroococcidiopsis sp. TS-821]|uniref:DapH/DapD/GlmU-related protein n=1 Tax=Chroococcidiopsis sp. TS-821 TaxID=1378066 RepID=UPI000CEE929D|nr:DapH/DapD/GlmU-related protein [Chroococcidiopsis sp. TS-821]PPS43119.1 transferase [Chroococcidiopsis sp. TS-821]